MSQYAKVEGRVWRERQKQSKRDWPCCDLSMAMMIAAACDFPFWSGGPTPYNLRKKMMWVVSYHRDQWRSRRRMTSFVGQVSGGQVFNKSGDWKRRDGQTKGLWDLWTRHSSMSDRLQFDEVILLTYQRVKTFQSIHPSWYQNHWSPRNWIQVGRLKDEFWFRMANRFLENEDRHKEQSQERRMVRSD